MASLFLFAFLSLALVSTSQADLISDVCSHSTNPSLCSQTLRSDPRSKGADLFGLGQVTIDKAISATKATVAIATSLSTGNIKGKAETCVDTCNAAISDLKECSTLLKARDAFSISYLQTEGSGALTFVSSCDDEFGESMPGNLKDASRKAQDIIDVLLVIANRL